MNGASNSSYQGATSSRVDKHDEAPFTSSSSTVSTSSSLCAHLSEFLHNLDGTEYSNEELIEKYLSESERSLLDCGLTVANMNGIAEEIEKTCLSNMENDGTNLLQSFNTLDRIHTTLIPDLSRDLDDIQRLVDSVEVRHQQYTRERSTRWIKGFFLPAAGTHSSKKKSNKSNSGGMKGESKGLSPADKARMDDFARYCYQIANTTLQDEDALLQRLDDASIDASYRRQEQDLLLHQQKIKEEEDKKVEQALLDLEEQQNQQENEQEQQAARQGEVPVVPVVPVVHKQEEGDIQKKEREQDDDEDEQGDLAPTFANGNGNTGKSSPSGKAQPVGGGTSRSGSTAGSTVPASTAAAAAAARTTRLRREEHDSGGHVML